MKEWRLVHIDEPQLAFGFAQKAEHPKDGLFLFGPPASNQNPARMDIGIIGTERAKAIYESWVQSIQTTIAEPEKGKAENKMMWPGFQAVFGIPWPTKPFAFCPIDGPELSRRIRGVDRHEAIYRAVNLYDEALRRYMRQEEAQPLLWYAIVPEEVYRYGRPQSSVPRELREPTKGALGKRAATRILREGSLFVEDNEAAAVYKYDLNFHNQLKARLLDTKQVIQVVRETTLAPLSSDESSRRSLQDPASVAWNLATTSFYKSGGRPWHIADVRDDVCYVGLVYKRIENAQGRDNACCGAQMFLSSGDGVVFKGAGLSGILCVRP